VSELKRQLRADLTTAMKARDSERSSTLRMVLTAITNAEVSGKHAVELNDEQVVDVLASEARRRREAARAYVDASRPDLAAKETAEGAVIAEYLPEPLSSEQVSQLVEAVIAELGVAAEGMRAMGRVMSTLQPRVRGRADGADVAAEVRRQLT
jgi:uncharacterized protein YqeY